MCLRSPTRTPGICRCRTACGCSPGPEGAWPTFMNSPTTAPSGTGCTTWCRCSMRVICRTRYDHRVNRLVRAFRKRRKRVLYDIDDFVFDTDHVHLIVQTLDL